MQFEESSFKHFCVNRVHSGIGIALADSSSLRCHIEHYAVTTQLRDEVMITKIYAFSLTFSFMGCLI